MRQLIQLYLQADGYDTDCASSGEEAIQTLEQFPIDLILLDVMMPRMDGFDVCTAIRKFSPVPIIMLTARESMTDKVIGLKLGADDYITKPFDQHELLARIESILRREQLLNKYNENTFAETKGVSKSILTFHSLRMNIQMHQVSFQEKELPLTPKEFGILRLFLSNKGRLFHREDIIELLWGTSHISDDRTVDTHIKNIRNKLNDIGIDGHKVIKTVWGTGYICHEEN
ncbi:DNA-binding response regulator [Paenibacillus sp. FSL A5-0031]|nr:DNA-binding response regulator [Paenibacillus sp. FSL A5-0031]